MTYLSDTTTIGSYNQNGFNITDADPGHHIYTQTLQNQYGCDSIIKLDLFYFRNKKTNIDETICEGETYHFFGKEISESGIYVDTTTSEYEEEITTLYLHVAEKHHHEMKIYTSEGTPYEAFGKIFSETGVYEERYISEQGCDSVVILDLVVMPVLEEIIPAEYFTPDGNGFHERWTIENIEKFPQANIRIFDRHGKLLFNKTNYSNEEGWDGTYMGYPMPSEDYWYVIDIPEIDKMRTGHFTLLRR